MTEMGKGVRGEPGRLLDPVESFGGDEVEDVADLIAVITAEIEAEETDEESTLPPRVLGYIGDGEALRRGDFFKQSSAASAVYCVVHVNQSRAHCVLFKGRSNHTIIDISPRATVIRVDPDNPGSDINPPKVKEKERTKMAVASIPVATPSTRQAEKARRVERGVRKSVAAAGKPAVKGRAAKVNKPPQTVRKCACGTCSEETLGFFAPGHDARFKGLMVKVERGTLPLSELPKKLQSAYKFVKRGDGYVSTTNYKGEKHNGYDTKK
jgi:hypothetical protein